MSAPDPGRVSWPKYALIVLGAAAGAEPRSADLGGPARVIRRTYASRGQALRPLQRPQAHPFTDSRPFSSCPTTAAIRCAGGSRGAGAHNGAHEARGHLHVLRSAPEAGCREPGASPLRARPPGRLQARAPACCPRALRRAGRRRPIAHERRGFVPGSLSVQDGRCGLRPRREGCCIGREAHLRLSTHQVPLSRPSALAGSPRDILIPQAKSARSQRITPPPQGRLPPPSTQPSAPASRSERVL